jgi:hypothetical protein
MKLRTIALTLTGAAAIGSGYFFLRSPTLGQDSNLSKIQKSTPRKYSWRGGESWIEGRRLYFTYNNGATLTKLSLDIESHDINPKDILAYEPGEKKPGILITRTGFLYLSGAQDVYFASQEQKKDLQILQMEKDVSGLRQDYGDFIAAQILKGVAYILTEQGAIIENDPDKGGWVINRLLDKGKVDPDDCDIRINGNQVFIKIGNYLFERTPNNIYLLR